MTCGDSATVEDFAALSRLLLGSRHADGVRALGSRGDNSGRNLGYGRLLDLLRDESVSPGAVFVAPFRPDVVSVDLDGCDWLLPDLMDAAAATGCAVVYLARSGSVDSMHAVFAPATSHGHAALLGAIDGIRRWSGVSATALDVRGPASPLRLPGANSLKATGGPVVPVDASLQPMSPKAATARAVDALKVSGLSLYPKRAPKASTAAVAAKSRRVKDRPITETLRGRIAGGWHNGFTMTPETRAAAETPAPAGANRTAHAASVAWLLYKDGGRSFDDVAPVVMVAPAFARWRRGGRPECERRWAMIVRRFIDWNPPMTDEESARLDAAATAAHVLPPDLVPVLLGIVEASRMNTDRDAMPVSCRSLVVWGVSSSAKTAHRALSALHEIGVLTRVRDYFNGPVSEATLWRVNGPETWDVDTAGSIAPEDDTRSEHPLPSIPEAVGPCSPLLWVLNHGELTTLRALLTGTPAFSVSTCAHHGGVAASTARAWLSRLVSLGLVDRVKRGRNVEYRAAVSVSDLREHPVWADAFEVWRARVAVVRADRDAWADWINENRGLVQEGDDASRAVVASRWSGEAFEAVESVEVRASGVTVRRTTYEPVGGDPGLCVAAAACSPNGDAVSAGPGVIQYPGNP